MRQVIENKAGFKKKACEKFEYFVSYQGASFGGSFDLQSCPKIMTPIVICH